MIALIINYFSVIGYFVKQRVTLGVPLMREWIDHNYLWLRRVAILHQVRERKILCPQTH